MDAVSAQNECRNHCEGRLVRLVHAAEAALLGWGALLLTLLLLVAPGCASRPSGPADWVAWQARRQESIGGTNGWTTLVGLHWLNEGEQTVGRDPTNEIVLRSRSAPGALGVFTRRGRAVTFAASPGAQVQVAGQPVERLDLITDADARVAPTRLQVGPVSVVAIQRGERLGLRVRDVQSPERQAFRGIRWFPYAPAWRLEGQYVPFAIPQVLRVADVIGGTQEYPSPGELVFRVAGIEHRLAVAVEEGESEYFILFRDATAGKSTYGSGRFLYVAPPTAGDGRVVIDFNRAYTPPCGFTAYATCPLSPRQNWLPVAVEAGERRPSGAHH